LAAADGTDGVMFDVLEPLPGSLERRRDAIELDAIFYRTVTYELANATAEADTRTVPYVLARSVAPLEVPAIPTGFGERNAWIVLILLGAAILWLVMRTTQVIRRRRTLGPKGAGFDAMFRQRMPRSGAPTAPSQQPESDRKP
jgi:hypothetical protein